MSVAAFAVLFLMAVGGMEIFTNNSAEIFWNSARQMIISP
jgi:hypothetical protein